ncbi:MAG TPA: sortase, partial [Patescibacteria group bacterium]
TQTPIQTSTPTPTLTPTGTPTETQTPTQTSTPTATDTPIITGTITVTQTPSITVAPTLTNLPSVTPTATETPSITDTPYPTATFTPGPTSTPTPGNNPPANTPTPTNTSGIGGNPEIASIVGSSNPRVLGSQSNYNPLVESIKSAFAGTVLGESTELAFTGDDANTSDKLPSDNEIIPGEFLKIPSLGLSDAVYRSQTLDGQLLVGHNEIIRGRVNNSDIYYAHNQNGLFGSLYKLSLGDAIFVETSQGLKMYQVTGKDYVPYTDLAAVKTADPGHEILLMTCSYDMPDLRIIVHAVIR